MKRIPVSKTKVALVDDCDFEFLSKWKWALHRDGYAFRCPTVKGKPAGIYMHRLVVRAKAYEMVDHRDGNPLNNTRSNLRFCTPSQSRFNTRLNKNNTSGYKGVWLHKPSSRWVAETTINYQRKRLGYFDSPTHAHEAYRAYVTKHIGEFARP